MDVVAWWWWQWWEALGKDASCELQLDCRLEICGKQCAINGMQSRYHDIRETKEEGTPRSSPIACIAIYHSL